MEYNCKVNGCAGFCNKDKAKCAVMNNNRLYVFKMKLMDTNGSYIYKIGKSSGKNSVDRMMQVIKSFHTKYRYTPYMSIKRDRPCADAFKFEAELHNHFKDNKYYFDKNIDGKTEWFYIEREDELLEVFDTLTA